VKRRNFLRALFGAFGAASVSGVPGIEAAVPRREIQITIAGSRAEALDYEVVFDSLTALREWLGASFSNTPDGGQP
jgi:hypothetical protein